MVGVWGTGNARARHTPSLRLAVGPSGDPATDRRWAARRLALDTTAIRVMAALDAAGLPVILLKGPVTATRLYPDAFRPYLDVDLLVPDREFPAAAAVITDLGFVRVSDSPVESGFRSPVDGCGIDLHRSIPLVGAAPADVWRVLSGHRVPFGLHRAVVPALDDSAMALHLALHAAQDSPVKPKVARDLYRAATRLPTSAWVGAWRLAVALDAAEVFTAALRCGPPAVRRLADRLGVPRQVSFRYRLLAHQRFGPVRMVCAVGAAGGVRAALRRWLLPSAAEIDRRLSGSDAGPPPPGVPPPVRYAALRLTQAVRTVAILQWELGRRVSSGAVAAARPGWRRGRAVARPAARLVTALVAVPRLPYGQRLLFIWYLVAVLRLEVDLRLRSPRRVLAGWARSARRARRRAMSVPDAQRQRLAVRAARVIRPGRTCLPVAMLLWREALAEGERSWLFIGVRTRPRFVAHAWVRRADGSVSPVGGRAGGLVPLVAWGPRGTPRRCGPAR